jgi:AAA15 family ATPase/GTPase
MELEGFNQINLIIGNNNVGKSSLLEAIFLLIGMSNPSLVDTVNLLRGFKVKNTDELKYLFHKVQINNSPNFKGCFSDNNDRELSLKPVFSQQSNEQNQANTSTATATMSGLELNFSIKQKHSKKKDFKSTITITPQQITQNQDKNYKEYLYAVYISGASNESNALMRYSEIVKRKKSDVILSAIQKIDPNIEALHPLPDGLYFSYKNIDELMPTNIAGDGVRKFLNIVTTIAEKPNSIVLIDEIENGLHYSAHQSIWESIIHISKEFNVQLFITSHNIETLTCLKQLLETSKYDDMQNKVNVFKLAQTKKAGLKAYRYSYEAFKDAIDNETEIR